MLVGRLCHLLTEQGELLPHFHFFPYAKLSASAGNSIIFTAQKVNWHSNATLGKKANIELFLLGRYFEFFVSETVSREKTGTISAPLL